MIRVYIAAHTEEQPRALALRALLRHHGITVNARWLDLVDVPRESADGAQVCLEDIEDAQVVVFLNPKPLHGTGTGGRHTEVGMALMARKPLVIVGERENVFHSAGWRAELVSPLTMTARELAVVIRQAARVGTPIPVDAQAHGAQA